MSWKDTPHSLSIQAEGVQHLINQVYRQSGRYQWVRETFQNALEARATRVHFGVEWHAVDSLRVYRRYVGDDGVGMNPTELIRFFRTFGGGGKPIGGEHENFGMGAKASLFPWNHHGLVVVSYQDGVPSMIWVYRHPESGEYKLRPFVAVDDWGNEEIVHVAAPFDDPEHGCHWGLVGPDWIREEGHGTVLVLLGNDPSQDSVRGDPGREEDALRGVTRFLNERFWELPAGVTCTVEEFVSHERWPASSAEAFSGSKNRRINNRNVEGAKFFVEYPKEFPDGKLASAGTVDLDDGTAVDWYLWEGSRPAVQSYAKLNGYTAALYKNELYELSDHHSRFRSFGVTENAVRERLWLIVRPPFWEETSRYGVYPRGDRNALLMTGAGWVGDPIPMTEWGHEFAQKLPEEVLEALRSVREGQVGTLSDPAWRERLKERFGSRWRILKLVKDAQGLTTVKPVQVARRPHGPRGGSGVRGGGGVANGRSGGADGDISMGSMPGAESASARTVAGGIPDYRTVGAADLPEGVLCSWEPPNAEWKSGCVLINHDHPVIEGQLRHWQDRFPAPVADEVKRIVLEVYGTIAVAKVAHSEALKKLISKEKVEEDLRSDAALTMSLLGLVAEEGMISTQLHGKLGRRLKQA